VKPAIIDHLRLLVNEPNFAIAPAHDPVFDVVIRLGLDGVLDGMQHPGAVVSMNQIVEILRMEFLPRLHTEDAVRLGGPPQASDEIAFPTPNVRDVLCSFEVVSNPFKFFFCTLSPSAENTEETADPNEQKQSQVVGWIWGGAKSMERRNEKVINHDDADSGGDQAGQRSGDLGGDGNCEDVEQQWSTETKVRVE
jgi:hypothetical protein